MTPHIGHGDQFQGTGSSGGLSPNSFIVANDERDTATGEQTGPSVKRSDGISNADMPGLLDSFDPAVMNIPVHDLAKNRSFRSAFAVAADSDLTAVLETRLDSHSGNAYGNWQSGLERLLEGSARSTLSGAMDYSDNASSSLTTNGTSTSSEVLLENDWTPVTPFSYSHASTSTEGQSSLQPSLRSLATRSRKFDSGNGKLRTGHALEVEKEKAENRFSWLFSDANLAEPGVPSSNSHSIHPGGSSSSNDNLDPSGRTTIGLSADSDSNAQLWPTQAQSTGIGNMTPCPSGSQGRSPVFARSLPIWGTSELFPIDARTTTSQLPRNIPSTPLSPPGGVYATKTRKRPRPVTQDSSAIEDNNIPSVLPPMKKPSRQKARTGIPDPTMLLSDIVPGPSGISSVPKETEKPSSKPKTERRMSGRPGTGIKVVVFEGELLSTEIIMDMLDLHYENPSDCRFQCIYPQCSESITRGDVLGHSTTHLQKLGHKNGKVIPCDLCPGTVKVYSSLNALARHVRDEHFGALQMYCWSCDRYIKRGTNEVIRRHLHSSRHRDLWNGLGLRWEYRHRKELNQDFSSGNEPNHIGSEVNGEGFQEGSSNGWKRRRLS